MIGLRQAVLPPLYRHSSNAVYGAPFNIIDRASRVLPQHAAFASPPPVVDGVHLSARLRLSATTAGRPDNLLTRVQLGDGGDAPRSRTMPEIRRQDGFDQVLCSISVRRCSMTRWGPRRIRTGCAAQV